MKDYKKYLRHQGRSKDASWTIFNLEAGFEDFYDKYGHYPSGPEIDKCDYLPSSRQIQRAFGGLQKLRKGMSLEHKAKNHNRGDIRSKMASMAHLRATTYEEEYFHYLIRQIPELYVHEHKVIRNGDHKTNSDFFIYYPDSSNGVVIDLFHPMDITNLLKIISIKIPKYKPMPHEIHLISMNKEIPQNLIASRISKRKSQIPPNIHVYNIDYFNSAVLPLIASKYRLP